MVAFGGSSLTCVTTGAFGVWGEIEARIQINWGEPHLVAIQTLGFLHLFVLNSNHLIEP